MKYNALCQDVFSFFFLNTKRAPPPSHLGGVIMGTLIAFPAATVDPSDT